MNKQNNKLNIISNVGCMLVEGILEKVEFNIIQGQKKMLDEAEVDVITLIISGRKVFVHPFREMIKIKNVPNFMDFSKKYYIIMKVRQYGEYFFAFDYDFYLAIIQEVKK